MIPVDSLLIGKDLNRLQSRNMFRHFFNIEKNSEIEKQILVLLQKKGEHSNELTGLIDAVRTFEKPIRLKVPFLVDGCGTGGDGKKTFNISTLACLIAAASGASVAKHGNRSISSSCGSADLLESLGLKIEAPKNRMLKALKKFHFGYFHAPLYHPIFKKIQPIRSELAKKRIKTIFNLAGPFLNPLRPRHQVIGVWRKDLVFMMAKTAQNLKFKHALIVWNIDGFDELTTSNKTVAAELRENHLRLKVIDPKQFHLKPVKPSDLTGGSIHKNRRITNVILSGKMKNGKFDVVLLNAGAILYVSGKVKTIREGILLAKQGVYSQSANRLLKNVIRISHDS